LGFRRCLDVSSPFLFSLLLRSKGIVDHVYMINPDPHDIAFTTEILSRLQVKGLTIKRASIEELGESDSYDAIWSLSVVEHIAGAMGDSQAIAKMFSLLSPGGRLILTLPVGREYLIQKRPEDIYNTGNPFSEDGLRFFQRVYDARSIRDRLVNAVGKPPTSCRWFGEKLPGTYAAYEKRWIRDSLAVTATDSWRIARDYQEYGSWEDMPGIGVCGLVFDKRKE
jgi:SAM-dependent methyltransferase